MTKKGKTEEGRGGVNSTKAEEKKAMNAPPLLLGILAEKRRGRKRGRGDLLREHLAL